MAAASVVTAEESKERSAVLGWSLLIFTTIYASAWLFMFKRWKGEQRRYRASSSCISFFHAVVSSTAAMIDMASSPWKLNAPNTSFQNKIMEWSIAYFIIDLAHYFIAVPDDYLFIAHHFATLTYMLSCRYFTHSAAKSVMCLLAAGEATTPLHAIWTIARLARHESHIAHRLYTSLSPVFTLLFTIVRGMLGPYLLIELTTFYLWGDHSHSHEVHDDGGKVPTWLAFCWMSKVAMAVVGSMIWGYKLWRGLYRFYFHKTTDPPPTTVVCRKYQ